MISMQKRKVIKCDISIGTFDGFVNSLIDLSKNKGSSYVCVCNVHMLIEASDSNNFSKVVNEADIVAPDGKPVAKAVEWLYGFEQPRVAGMDLIESLFIEIDRKGLKVFLYGSTNDVLDKMATKACKQFPGLNVVGTLSPPFRELNIDEDQLDVDTINNCNPDFVFVALGCPKQERWMAEHKDKINSCMIGLGGAFPVYAGMVERSPTWMQKYGLEWLFRLIKDPKRLYKRYFYTNTKFIVLLAIQLFSKRLFFGNKK
jgi:N-acetylglucosaminyldiphosphoundecaprenol N-acetyl-beta-D-mannosaminyltransferase